MAPSDLSAGFEPFEGPPVAVVVVSWNLREITCDCVRSLLALDYPSVQVIVVDNGSTDGSAEAVRRLGMSHTPAGGGKRIEVVELPSNEGFARGANVGIQRALAAEAAYVWLLNNDTVVDPSSLGALVDFARVHPEAAAVGPKVLYARERPELVEGRDRIWFAGGRISYWFGHVRHVGLRELDRGQHDQPRQSDYITGCAVLASCEALKRVGRLDPTFGMYAEDTDWCHRAREAGYELWYVPEARVWHRISVSSGGAFTPRKIIRRLRGQLAFFRRTSPCLAWLGPIPLGLAWNACRAIGGLLKYAASIVWWKRLRRGTPRQPQMHRRSEPIDRG